MYEKAGRAELAEKEKGGNGSADGLYAGAIARAENKRTSQTGGGAIRAKGEKEIGKVMAVLMPQVKGKSDGALVNKIVRELLNNIKV